MAEVVAETELERRIMADPDWRTGAAWGTPRDGHPEGAIVNHIAEVLRNVDRYATGPEQRRQLRLVALIHDTMKFQVHSWLPHRGKNDHGKLARAFAERYVDDRGLLRVIEHHDDAYRAWRRGKRTGRWRRAERRARAVAELMGDELDLFRVFYRCDNETGDKAPDDRIWFERLIAPS